MDDNNKSSNNSHEVAVREQNPAMVVHAQERTADEIIARLDKIREVQAKAMKANIDYGVIPGTERKDKDGKDISKPTLLKPGAEKLCVLFNLDAQFIGEGNSEQMIVETTEKGEKIRHLLVKRYCTLYSQVGGARLGGASAICSTMETKYAYRKGARECPDCHKPTLIHTKRDTVNWWCNSYNEGCGKNFQATDERITSQQVGRIANLDVADQYNTVIRIGEKRALVAVVRQVTGASAIFDEEAPDVEDMYSGHDDGGAPVQTDSKTSTKKEAPKAKPKEEKPATATGEAKKEGSEATAPAATTIAKVDEATAGEIQALFDRLTFPDEASRENKRQMILRMFSIQKDGTFADVTAPNAKPLIKILTTQVEQQEKASGK